MSKAISKSPGRGWVVTDGWRDVDGIASNEGVCGYDDDAYDGKDNDGLRDSEETAGWMEDEGCWYDDDSDDEKKEEGCGWDPWFKVLEEEE